MSVNTTRLFMPQKRVPYFMYMYHCYCIDYHVHHELVAKVLSTNKVDVDIKF